MDELEDALRRGILRCCLLVRAALLGRRQVLGTRAWSRATGLFSLGPEELWRPLLGVGGFLGLNNVVKKSTNIPAARVRGCTRRRGDLYIR